MTTDVATTGYLKFEGAVTIRTAEAICTKLRETIMQHAGVSIDCFAVTEVDLSFVQLLLAARASTQSSHKRLVLAVRPDGALLNVLTRGGFRVTTLDQTGEETAFWFEGAGA